MRRNPSSTSSSRVSRSSFGSSLRIDPSTPTWYHNLPLSVLIRIFRYFDQNELRTLMLVCQQWKYATENPALWKSFTVRGDRVPIYFICKKIRSWTKLETVHADNILEPAAVIRQVCRCIPGIKHLAIRHCTPVPESAVRFIIKSCSHLESLDFSGTQIKGTTFYKELAALAQLKKLNLSSNPHLTTQSLITAVLNCRNLVDLRISKYLCKTEMLRDDDAVLIFMSVSGKLTSLSFDCATLSVSTFGVIFNCRKLERLCLYCATNLYGEQFASLWQHFPNLTKLKITNAYQIADIHMLELFHKGEEVMRNLVILDFSGCWKITDTSLETITKIARRLQKLSLKSCKSITNLESVSKNLDSLQVLNIGFMKTLRLNTMFPLPRDLQVLYVDENEKVLGWLKSVVEGLWKMEIRICLSEYNKKSKRAEI